MATRNETLGKQELSVIKYIDTGDIWICPCCQRAYHLIHKEPPTKSETGGHKFEEMPDYKGKIK